MGTAGPKNHRRSITSGVALSQVTHSPSSPEATGMIFELMSPRQKQKLFVEKNGPWFHRSLFHPKALGQERERRRVAACPREQQAGMSAFCVWAGGARSFVALGVTMNLPCERASDLWRCLASCTLDDAGALVQGEISGQVDECASQKWVGFGGVVSSFLLSIFVEVSALCRECLSLP